MGAPTLLEDQRHLGFEISITILLKVSVNFRF